MYKYTKSKQWRVKVEISRYSAVHMMMLPSKAGIFLSLLSLTGVVAGLSQTGAGVLGVYGPVPGLPPSPYYRLQVREGGS